MQRFRVILLAQSWLSNDNLSVPDMPDIIQKIAKIFTYIRHLKVQFFILKTNLKHEVLVVKNYQRRHDISILFEIRSICCILLHNKVRSFLCSHSISANIMMIKLIKMFSSLKDFDYND